MGKFFISNSKESNEAGKNFFERAGIVKFERIEKPKYFLSIYKKRKIENENLYIFDNGDFVGINGTCIYKGKIGKKSLVNIYNEFNNISGIRKNAIGHYAIIIKKDNNIKIFTDKYNLYKVYFYIYEDSWVISNSLKAVAETLNRKVINKYKLFEEIIQIEIMGKETFYKGIYRLFGNEVIEVNTESGNIVINKFDYQRETYNLIGKSLADCVNMYIPHVKKVFSSINNVFGDNLAIEQTGGFDTRCVFSALNSVGGKARLLYGVSDNPIVNQKEGDLEIVANLSKKFNRDLYIMNWRSDCKIDEVLYGHYFEKYGFYFRIYGCNDNYFKEYEGLIPNYPKLFMNGYFGENLKEREWLNTILGNSVNIHNIINWYHIPLWISSETFKAKSNLKEYKNYLQSELINIAQNTYGLRVIRNTIRKDDFNELRQIFSRCMDNTILNFQNEFSYSLSPFGDLELYEPMFNIPYKYRNHNLFQFELIKALDSTVLEIPIFAHCKLKSLKQGRLITEKVHIKNYLRNYLSPIYKKLVYVKQKHINRNDLIISEYQNYLKDNSILAKYFNIDKIIDLWILSRMVLYTFAINKIGFDSIE